MRITIALATLFVAASVLAENPAEQIEFFEKRIRPVLAQECYSCHSVSGKKKGGLLLDSREGWKKGGSSGDAIVVGDPQASLLIKAIRHEVEEGEMPKEGAKLDERVIRDFEAWIKMGAPDPRDKPPTPDELTRDTSWTAILQRRKSWWSFQPIQNPPVPAVKNAAWSEQPVDRFLLSKMESEKLEPAADADPRLYFRRLNFVLTGLPPAPDETNAFVAAYSKNQQQAIDAAADRLLASPRFGERWARHWMDWVRYADTYGSEGDPAIPFAWRYRDYLIRALNSDVPYPQLVREHIAGDLLAPRANPETNINESALGIAHYRMVLHGFTPTDAHDEQVTFTDNQIDTITKAFLGVTVSCARCHNHKFDPISQADFYSMYGMMVSSRPAMIDVNLPDRQKLNIEKLTELKKNIRGQLAETWLKQTDDAVTKMKVWKGDKKQPNLPAPLDAWSRFAALPADKWDAEWSKLIETAKNESKRQTDFCAQDAFLRWDMRGAEMKQWVAEGAGLIQGASPPGEFSILVNGDRVVSQILPTGTYSHLISDKLRAVLSSPNFNSEGGKLWFRVRGSKARARYVVRNYPRTGLIYPKHDMNSENDQWVSYDLNYWKGESLYLEVTTEADQPIETGNVERSWFGISEVIYAKNAKGPPPPSTATSLIALFPEPPAAPKSADELALLYQSTLRRCIEAFRDQRMTDADAEFLSAFVQQNFLPNKLADLPGAASLITEYRRLESEIPVPTRAPGLLEGFAADHALFDRGDHKKPVALVPRRFLDAINAQSYQAGPTQSGRKNLAESFVALDNPLTDRVIVNRLWHHVFGQGIVITPDNMGRLGELPTHPELLDYLATRMRTEGGSLKKIIRLLVTSRAFRLSHSVSKQAAAGDPNNKWLTHFSSHRLDAEAIRDSMLALTGKLEQKIGGAPADGGSNRRSVYMKVIRNNLDPLLTAFDFPVPSGTRGKRDATNVPAQSLALLNSPLVNRWAGDWAARVLSNRSAKDDENVRRMFNEALGRDPSESDLKESLEYVRSMVGAGEILKSTLAETEKSAEELRKKMKETPESKSPPDAALIKSRADLARLDEQLKDLREKQKAASAPDFAWRSLAQALFNAKEFIYVR